MIWEIELLYFVAMIATFIILLLVVKMPSGIAMMASALVGLALSAIFSDTEFSLRFLVEGGFGYFDTILVITMAMIFMGALQATGALDYFCAVLVKAFYKFPTILLIFFMFIIMFPAMITGSSLSSVISTGAIVAPIMIKMGIPKAKVGAIVAFGAIFGMIAPPVNIPVMAICEVVDIPFTGFTLPLLLLTLPLAIFTVLFLGRKHVKKIDLDQLSEVMDLDITKRMSWLVSLPLILLVVLILLSNIIPSVFGSWGMTLIFFLSTVPAFFVGKKTNPVKVFNEGVKKSFSAMALLLGVGMFVEVLTLSGARGFFVINAISLPKVLKYVAIAVSMPIFGGISAFGSASILGGPFVMAFLENSQIIMASALSLVAALGEFLPPTAMSATFATEVVGEDKYFKITKAALIPLIVTLVYAMVFIIFVSRVW